MFRPTDDLRITEVPAHPACDPAGRAADHRACFERGGQRARGGRGGAGRAWSPARPLSVNVAWTRQFATHVSVRAHVTLSRIPDARVRNSWILRPWPSGSQPSSDS